MTRARLGFGLAVLAVVAGVLAAARPAQAVSPSIVISQVYGGGGNSGATLKNDFIELYNRGSSAVDLSAWSVQYASSAGTSWTKTDLTGSIAAGGHYLIKQATGNSCSGLPCGVALPTADASGSTTMSSSSGKIALVSIVGRIAPGWLLDRGTAPLALFSWASVIAALSIVAMLAAPLTLASSLLLFAVFQVAAGALPFLFLHAELQPDLAIPFGSASVDIRLSATENVRRVAAAKQMAVEDVTVVLLDRPRHEELAREIREAGARIKFISDGDVAGAIMAARPDTGIDLMLGIGGTPEGIITACAMKCLGGAIQGRLWPTDDAERQRALDAGHALDPDVVLHTDDLVTGDDCFFAATGITDGELMKGVRYHGGLASTESLVMRSRSGTVRRITSDYRLRAESPHAPAASDRADR